MELWLRNEIAKLVPEVAYEAPRGTEGEFRVVKPLDRIRFTHCHPGTAAASTVQVALLRPGQQHSGQDVREKIAELTPRQQEVLTLMLPACGIDGRNASEDEPHTRPHAAVLRLAGTVMAKSLDIARMAATSPTWA